MKLNADRISWLLFQFSLMLVACGYGIAVGKYEIFPFRQLYAAKHAFDRVTNRTEYYIPAEAPREKPVHWTTEPCAGVNLVTSVVADNRLSARIMDMNGKTLHEWPVDWFDIWGEGARHVPDAKRPKSRPGTHIHGAVVTPDGGLVFNFEELGLVRLDRTGNVVWRLPYQTHHSVHVDDNGHFWVCGLKRRDTRVPEYPNYAPPFSEYTVLEVDPDGAIVREISVFDLFVRNDLRGLLYLSTLAKRITEVSGDTLHLNDVETFPRSMEPGIFDAGDVMISLRNINTVVVFQPETLKIKWVCVGAFVRQHDPDFLDGNTISVFDNNNTGTRETGATSRIVTISARTGQQTVAFEGSDSTPFFTDIMGKHQWLPDGRLLITESAGGRAFEVDANGTVIWEFVNVLSPTQIGIVQEVTRLPPSLAGLFAD